MKDEELRQAVRRLARINSGGPKLTARPFYTFQRLHAGWWRHAHIQDPSNNVTAIIRDTLLEMDAELERYLLGRPDAAQFVDGKTREMFLKPFTQEEADA